MSEVSIAELVGNGTMSAEMAAVLWAAVDEPVSFLTAAVRLAGKSTISGAALALRRPGLPLRTVTGEPEEVAWLERERAGGYLQIEGVPAAPPYLPLG